MGLFDFLPFLGGPEKQLKRHVKRIKHKDAQLEDRQASAIWLAETAQNATDPALFQAAVKGLLGRFEMTYEHHMKDAQEKDDVADLVLGLGDRAAPAIESFLRRTRSFAHPLSLYQQITGEDSARELVLELLEKEREGSELKPEKKRLLMIKLGDFRHAEIAGRVIPFLDDFDHDVRYATVEVLIAQEGPTDAIREALVARLAHPDEDDNRLRGRIAEVVQGRSWPLGEHAGAIAERPPQGWQVQGGRLTR